MYSSSLNGWAVEVDIAIEYFPVNLFKLLHINKEINKLQQKAEKYLDDFHNEG